MISSKTIRLNNIGRFIYFNRNYNHLIRDHTLIYLSSIIYEIWIVTCTEGRGIYKIIFLTLLVYCRILALSTCIRTIYYYYILYIS